MWINIMLKRILRVTFMRIGSSLPNIGSKPKKSSQIGSYSISYTLACHLQINPDPDPAYHFDTSEVIEQRHFWKVGNGMTGSESELWNRTVDPIRGSVILYQGSGSGRPINYGSGSYLDILWPLKLICCRTQIGGKSFNITNITLFSEISLNLFSWTGIRIHS